MLAPQTIVQPLFLVGEMIAPALIGLYVFAEREALDRQEQLYFAVGLLGGVLVALSFSGGLSRRRWVGQPWPAHA
jgi:hypothetical protein